MDYETVEAKIHDFLKQKLEESGAEGYVIGVSGGLDSATSLKLAVESVGKENVSAWIMSGKPSRKDNMDDARSLCKEMGVEIHDVDIEPIVEQFNDSIDFELEKEAVGNIRARTRMILEYIDSNHSNKLVIGTGNRSEYLMGYFTKHGDGATDVNPLNDIYKTQVKELADHIGIPNKFIEKEPSAGLWEGQTDEKELSESYENADRILRSLVDDKNSVEQISDETKIDISTVKRIKMLYESTEHKRTSSAYPELRH